MVENWTKLTNALLGDKADMYLISSGNITVCRFDFKEATLLPEHIHDSEQITVVLEGEITIRYDGVEKKMGTGDVCIIPSNMKHSAEITRIPFRSYDIFHPIRSDFISEISGL